MFRRSLLTVRPCRIRAAGLVFAAQSADFWFALFPLSWRDRRESVSAFDELVALVPLSRRSSGNAASPLLRRTIRRLPETVRAASAGEPRRCRECRVALPVRRACRSPAREGGPVAGRHRFEGFRRGKFTRCFEEPRSRKTCWQLPVRSRWRSSMPACTVGLYFEAIGDARRAIEHITVAAADRYADAGGYMHAVAKVHLMARRQ